MSKDYTRHAIWLLVAYSVVLTMVVWGVQKGLWEAIDANYKVMELRTSKQTKLPCSSEINEDCAIYIK